MTSAGLRLLLRPVQAICVSGARHANYPGIYVFDKIIFPQVRGSNHRRADGTFHFQIEFLPLRNPRLLKYLAGPEIGGGNFLSDTLPEEKAAELQNVSNVHYKTRK